MSSNTEIKSNLFTIYDKISKPNTKEVGYELFKKLISKNIHSQSNMNTIINNLNDFLTVLNPKEKEPNLKLLSLIFYTEDLFNKEIYFQYLSPVLSIIQVLIKDSNSSIFPQISETYANIVQNLMPTDIEATNDELEPNEKRAYELLQGFCIYNMKFDDKNNKILGSLCLTKLVENCPIVLKPNYLKFIWENLINFIDKKNFNAKHEILNCLISLILGAEDLFNPYANVTLYKVLDFLTENDWLKRKLALNIIYTLIVYCKEEILPLKEHIINFLKALKTDKVKEVREVCLLILQIFNENDDGKKKKTNVQGNLKRKKIKNVNNDINNNSFNNNNNNSIDLSNRDNNNNNNIKKLKINNSNNNINNKKKRENSKPSNIRNIKNENFFNNNKQFNDNNGIDVITVDFKKKNKQIENKRSKTPISNKNINNNNNNNNNNLNTSDINNVSYDNNTTSNFNNTKKNFVNRRADNTFVDEKMVIKRDPNKSISKAKPNMDFFKNVNKQQDIIVLAKGKNNFKYDDNNENFVVTKKKDNNNNNEVNNNEIKEKNNESLNNDKNNEENLINIKKEKINSNIQNNNENNNDFQNDDNQLINSQNKKKSYSNKNNNINNNHSKKNSNNNIKNNFDENKYNNNNNNEFNYNINNINPNLINSLIEQMNSLSQKQIILIDTIDKIQSSTNDKINKLDNKILSLENNIESLNNKLNNIRSNNYNY